MIFCFLWKSFNDLLLSMITSKVLAWPKRFSVAYLLLEPYLLPPIPTPHPKLTQLFFFFFFVFYAPLGFSWTYCYFMQISLHIWLPLTPLHPCLPSELHSSNSCSFVIASIIFFLILCLQLLKIIASSLLFLCLVFVYCCTCQTMTWWVNVHWILSVVPFHLVD